MSRHFDLLLSCDYESSLANAALRLCAVLVVTKTGNASSGARRALPLRRSGLFALFDYRDLDQTLF